MALQLIGTKGLSRRELWAWTARANSSLPVPVSPSSSTLLRESAILRTSASSARIGALSPTIWSNP